MPRGCIAFKSIADTVSLGIWLPSLWWISCVTAQRSPDETLDFWFSRSGQLDIFLMMISDLLITCIWAVLNSISTFSCWKPATHVVKTCTFRHQRSLLFISGKKYFSVDFHNSINPKNPLKILHYLPTSTSTGLWCKCKIYYKSMRVFVDLLGTPQEVNEDQVCREKPMIARLTISPWPCGRQSQENWGWSPLSTREKALCLDSGDSL